VSVLIVSQYNMQTRERNASPALFCLVVPRSSSPLHGVRGPQALTIFLIAFLITTVLYYSFITNLRGARVGWA